MKNSNPNPHNEIATFVRQARSELEMSQERLAELLHCTKANISAWENGRHQPKFDQLSLLSQISGIALPRTQKEFDRAFGMQKYSTAHSQNSNHVLNSGNSKYGVNYFAQDFVYMEKIRCLDSIGTCGGNSNSTPKMSFEFIYKEKRFFDYFKLHADYVVAVQADGDGMADFIVDGDIVVFDQSMTKPKSGNIYLIEHPDGIRIKQVRREIDGTWILENRNSDKRKFPDERISSDQDYLLRILGLFVYRQGVY